MVASAENDAYREFGERQVEHERLLALALVEMGRASTTRTRDWVAATEVMDILEPLNDAFGLGPDGPSSSR